MDLSIIIPIYNTDGETLEKCFASICAINGIQYECILVDDGSIAETEEYCRMYALKHSGFFYVRKENGGVSSARNLGISMARGRFVCFVDSDDKIVPNIYSVPGLLNETYDLIFTDLVEINGNARSLWKAFDEPGEISYENAVERMVRYGQINGPYCKLYKRSFLEKSCILFREDMVQGEDAVFLCEILRKKPKMKYCDMVSYFYSRSYNNGNRRFQMYPVKCISNATRRYKELISCIYLGAFSLQKKMELLSHQKKTYIHELLGRALDSIENNIITKDIQSAIKEGLSEISEEPYGRLGHISRLKMVILNHFDGTVVKCVEKLRLMYFKIKKIR